MSQDFVIDAAHLAHQREWSTETFGPGFRRDGVIDHIRKELVEIQEAYTATDRLAEWVDVIILARHGTHLTTGTNFYVPWPESSPASRETQAQGDPS